MGTVCANGTSGVGRQERDRGAVYRRAVGGVHNIRVILETNPPKDEFTEQEERDKALTTELMQFYILIVNRIP
jgi:hypothetical protein